MSFQIVIDALTQIVLQIVNFIPNLINGLIILLVGYFVAWLVRWLVAAILARVRFDPLVERTGITGSLRGLGITTPLSQILAQTLFFLLLLSFLITATRLMGLAAVAQVLEQVLDFLPSLIAALIVFLLGGIVAKFVGDLVATLSASAGLSYASRLGRLVQHLISLLVVVVALRTMGIDTAILVTAFSIMLAAFGLALGLGLGLGARGIVRHILSGYYMQQRFSAGQPIVFDQIRGEVGGIGSVNTVVTTAEGEVIIPNSALLEAVVERPRTSERGQSDLPAS